MEQKILVLYREIPQKGSDEECQFCLASMKAQS
jgi:hypothetical protein